MFTRGEFRRAFPGEIGDLSFPPRVMEAYALELLRCVDTSGLKESGLKVVVDTGGGTASLVLPSLLGRLGVDALTVNNGLNEMSPTESADERREALRRLGRLVASSKAAFGVHFDPVGERISIVDERGHAIDDERALLVVLDLVAAEADAGSSVALPVITTRVAEQVAAFHGVDIHWIALTPAALTEAVTSKAVVFGGDGRGGFVVPAFSNTFDGIAAFVQLAGPGGPHPAAALRDRRPDPAGAMSYAGRCRPPGRPRGWSCARSSRRPVTGSSTRPTACAWSSRTAGGCWSCPTPPSR